jgi:hypothetical protein
MNRFIIALGLAWLVAPVWADDSVSTAATAPTQSQIAEQDRISDEMRQLSKRGVWSGVERKYEQLGRLGIPMQASDHLTAAYAARESGELNKVYERLKAAASVEGTKEIVDWLYDIDHNYGRVTLVADGQRSAKLSVAEMPLDPNQRKAIQAAIDICDKKGRFVGLLPRGRYEFATQAFRVEPGVGVRVEVSPEMRRKGLIEPVIIYRELPSATGNQLEPK